LNPSEVKVSQFSLLNLR